MASCKNDFLCTLVWGKVVSFGLNCQEVIKKKQGFAKSGSCCISVGHLDYFAIQVLQSAYLE